MLLTNMLTGIYFMSTANIGNNFRLFTVNCKQLYEYDTWITWSTTAFVSNLIVGFL